MINREQLEQQLKDLEAQKVTLFDSGSADPVAVGRLNEQIKGIQAQLSALDISNIAEDVKTSEFPFILEVNGESINFRDWIHQEVNYQVIAIGVSQKIYEMDAIRNAQLAERDQLIEQERAQHAAQMIAADESNDAKYGELYEQFQALKLEAQTLKAENAIRIEELQASYQIKAERDEFERKLQAAGNEIESLKNQLAAAQVKDKPVVTNMDSGALAEAIRLANEAKPRIYNKRAGDSRTSFYLANLLENDEEISIPWTRIGQYVEASEAEVQRFQSEREANKDIPDVAGEVTEVPTDELAVTIEVPTFRDADTVETVQEYTADGTVAEETIGSNSGTVEERLNALELAVFGQVRAA